MQQLCTHYVQRYTLGSAYSDTAAVTSCRSQSQSQSQSHSLNAMQFMLKICDDFAIDYNLKFNAEKSVAMRIGARHKSRTVEPKLCVVMTSEELQSALYCLKYLNIVF